MNDTPDPNKDAKPSWKIEQSQLGWLINRLPASGIMFNKKKHIPICCKYHNTGMCVTDFPLAKSHNPMPSETGRLYMKFMKEAKRELSRQQKDGNDASSAADEDGNASDRSRS